MFLFSADCLLSLFIMKWTKNVNKWKWCSQGGSSFFKLFEWCDSKKEEECRREKVEK